MATLEAGLASVYRRLVNRFIFATALVALSGCTASSINSVPHSPLEAASGRWAVRLDGKPIIILDLNRDPKATGGWEGTFSDAAFMMTQEHKFSHVQGPGGSKPIVWAHALADTLEFKAGRDRDIYTFRPLANGTALMGWKGTAVEPLVLSRARDDEKIPPVWDASKVYQSEDGHS